MISAQPLDVELGALQPLIVNTSDWSWPPRLSAALSSSSFIMPQRQQYN